VPFSFLPLNGLSDTQLDLFLSAPARDAAGQDNEQLLGRRVMAADRAVELRERDVQVAAGYAGVDEAPRREMLDRPRGKLDPFHAEASSTGVNATSMCTPIR
jgi:hypothetical protein